MFKTDKSFQIPIPCPKCNGKLMIVMYEATLKILQHRSWQICNDCGYERSNEQYLKGLMIV